MTSISEQSVLNDRYRLDEKLGTGGMGTVYRAHDATLDRDVAVKMVSSVDLDTQGQARLLQEAQAIAKLNHPNIVSVYDAGQIDGNQPYIVMELVSGKTLYESPPDNLEGIISVGSQVSLALDHAHSQGIVHRDLEPENVLIEEGGTAKLMDFGIARSVATRMTSEGQIVGTVFYLAPELALGQEFDGRADLYALGVMLYELTTGDLPFAADDPLAVISQHLHASVVPPKAKIPELPPLVDTLIVQLMSKNPEDRPASAADVHEYLGRADLLDPDAEGEKEVLVLDRIVRGRFVGREQELSEARSLWSKSAAGDGQTLLVSGEPGIGKTRLMRELSTHVEITGGKSLVGACYAEGGAPYSPFAQIIRRALENGAGNGNSAATDLPEFVLADLLDLAPELKPYYPDVAPNPALEPEAEQQRLFENVVGFCSTISERAPLMLVVDDAHWADSGSLSLIRHLARRLRKKPVLLLATYREVELDEARPFNEVLLDLNRERLARRIKLSRLTRDQTEALLGALFEDEISAEFLEAIYRETEGNPFFVEEVCKTLVESGKLYFEDGEWHRPNMDELEIPQSVKVALQARISTMPEEHQEALRMAAVMGREFDYDTLAAASELEETALIEALEIAERSQLIEEAGGVRFEFVHALIPSTLVESMHTLRRRIMHREAAAAIEKLRPEDYEALAHHFGEAGNDEQALKYYVLAGDQAAKAFANQDAESHFRGALNLAKDNGQRADLLSAIGTAVASQGRFDEAVETWNSAIEIYETLEQLDRAAWCYARSARAAWEGGEYTGALGIADEGMAAIGDAADSADVADLLHETARECYFAGEPERARSLCKRALEMAERTGAVKVQVESLVTMGVLKGVPSDDAVAYLEQGVELAHRSQLLRSEARARNNLSAILVLYRGEIASAREHLRAAGRLARQVGEPAIELFYRTGDVRWAIWQGDLPYADQEFLELDQLYEAASRPGFSGHYFRFTKVSLGRYRGELEDSVGPYQQLASEAREGGNLLALSGVTVTMGDLFIELGDLEAAEVALRESFDAGKNIGYRVRALVWLAILEAARGNVEEARGYVEEAQTQREEEIAAVDRPSIARAEALIASAEGRSDRAWKHFKDELRHLEQMGLGAEIGRTLMTWGRLSAEQGEKEQAERLLADARAQFHDIGALAYVERVDALHENLGLPAS